MANESLLFSSILLLLFRKRRKSIFVPANFANEKHNGGDEHF